MNEIIATLWSGAPLTAIVLALVCSCVAYAYVVAYTWDKRKYGLMTILIAMLIIGMTYGLGLVS
jgi:ABC-type multidrug transport system permease subunit